MQERGWATQLCAGVGEGGYERNSAVFLFDVNITLTEAGLAAGSGLGLIPAGLLFEFLAMLQKAGPQRCAHPDSASACLAEQCVYPGCRSATRPGDVSHPHGKDHAIPLQAWQSPGRLLTYRQAFAYVWLSLHRVSGVHLACWCRWAFDELAKIAEMKFRFAEEEDACEYVTRLAADMPVRTDATSFSSQPLTARRVQHIYVNGVLKGADAEHVDLIRSTHT